MSQRLFPYTISLVFIYVLACSPPIHGQSPPNSARCFPLLSLTSDDKAELTGKKVLPKVIVDDVVFDGPISLPASIRDQLIADLKEHAALSSGTDWLEEWNEVAVRGAWQDQGFFKMTSTAKAQIVSSDASEQHVSVTVHVDEGMQYRLKDIRFRKSPDDWVVQNAYHEASEDEAAGNGKPSLRKKVVSDNAEQPGLALAFPPEELRKRVPLSEGELFRTSQIRDGLDALKRLYGSYGYINFVASPITEVDDRSGMISLILELDEGKQFRIRSVEVQGLAPQTKGALKWRIQAGDLFNYELFKDFFTDNKGILPSGASPLNAELHKNEKSGTVDIRFVFPSCP
jgi:hypothetical protein